MKIKQNNHGTKKELSLQLVALRLCEDRCGYTSVMRKELGMSHTELELLISSLEFKGLIRRAKDDCNHLELTREGVESLKKDADPQ